MRAGAGGARARRRGGRPHTPCTLHPQAEPLGLVAQRAVVAQQDAETGEQDSVRNCRLDQAITHHAPRTTHELRANLVRMAEGHGEVRRIHTPWATTGATPHANLSSG
jgi:hypothetical protein